MKYKIFLGSKSIRRRNILKSMDIDFNVLHSNIKEDYPDNLKGKNVSEFLARIKSEDLISNISNNEILITADTIVLVNNNNLSNTLFHLEISPAGLDNSKYIEYFKYSTGGK